MMKNLLRAVSMLLVSAMLLLGLSACGKYTTPAPAFEDVKDEFIALMKASVEINDIFFGEGLPVYDRETASGDGSMTYDEPTGIYYIILSDAVYVSVLKYYDKAAKENRYAAVIEKEYTADEVPSDGISFGEGGEVRLRKDGKITGYKLLDEYTEVEREIVYDEHSPAYYDFVRLDCPYQDVPSIKAAAEKVYSANYLEAVYVPLFDGYITTGQVLYARYMRDETGEHDFLMKSNRFEPYFSEQTTYDFSTMKMVKPSNGSMVNVEIEAEGNYIDAEQKKVLRGKLTKLIRFVKEADGWRLDTPTY